METSFAVYMLASKPRGVLYLGATADLIRRIWQHKNNSVAGFSRKYRTHRLVWYELHADMPAAVQREYQLKKWNRLWKYELIEKMNPSWKDLYDELF